MTSETRYILQTFYFDANGQQLGFNREFATREAAQEYTENYMCGSKWEILEVA